MAGTGTGSLWLRADGPSTGSGQADGGWHEQGIGKERTSRDNTSAGVLCHGLVRRQLDSAQAAA